jgi:ATP-dependent Clp protease ATP-binding subunit ClpC
MGLFDRFNRLNDQAMRVFAFAQDEAVRLNHREIGIEHLLLGLIREGQGIAARVLEAQGLELSQARAAVTVTIGRGDSATSAEKITLSPRAKKVIERAIDEARRLGHKAIGAEHLLLGLVREGEARAPGVLESLGVSHVKVCDQVIAMLKEHHGVP